MTTGLRSEWISEEWDAGAVYSGTWKVDTAAITALVGSVTVYLELSSTSGSGYASYAQTAKVATARYARVRAVAASGSTLIVDGDVTLRLDVVAQEETHTGTSNASAAVTVSLDRTYTYTKAVEVTPISDYGSYGAMVGVVDNINLSAGTLDVYVFQLDGTQRAVDFTLRFLGV